MLLCSPATTARSVDSSTSPLAASTAAAGPLAPGLLLLPVTH